MPEVPDPSKRHRHAKPVGSLNNLAVAHRPSRLDNRRSASLRNGLQAIRERKKSVRGGNSPLQRKNRLHRPKPGSIHPAHLPCPNSNRLAVPLAEPGIDDRV